MERPVEVRREAARRALAKVKKRPVEQGEHKRDMRQERAYQAGREPRRMEREALR